MSQITPDMPGVVQPGRRRFGPDTRRFGRIGKDFRVPGGGGANRIDAVIFSGASLARA
jgi:hypothetical protein